jgi:RHS repeat-associated protein
LQAGNTTYLYGDARIAQYAGGVMTYFLGDALGSVRQLASASGAVLTTRSYTPYGELLSSSGEGSSAYGFTGEWDNGELQMLYLRSRMYSSGTGRFLTRDTWQGDDKTPMSYNAWVYGYSNPVKYTDPTGQSPIGCSGYRERLDYENCVRRNYKLAVPKSHPVMDDTKEGEWGCWHGPVAYKAPGYLEGLSGFPSVIVGVGFSQEIVYDFATMESGYFESRQYGLTDQIGASLAEYQGIAYGFNNVNGLAKDYGGGSVYASVGVGTDFLVPSPQLGVGLLFSFAVGSESEVASNSQYFSIGASAIDFVLFADLAAGYGYSTEVKSRDRYSNIYTGKVDLGRLLDDITFGYDSPATIPMPSVLLRAHGAILALDFARVYEAMYADSQ